MEARGLLRELLRIDTTNPPGNEEPCAQLLESQLGAAGLKTEMLKSPGGRVNLVARVPGPSTSPALVLLSHTDVVPVEKDRWSVDPFSGSERDGHIWGRGALDMKGIAVMHACAAVNLAQSSTPTREVIVVSVADEEAGGHEGAEWLLRAHPDLVGFEDGRPPPEVIGEGAFGLAGLIPAPLMPVVLGEKQTLWLDLKATGDPGHGALPPANQAVANLAKALGAVAGYGRPRVHPILKEQFRILREHTRLPRSALFGLMAGRAANATATSVHRQLQKTGMIGALVADTYTPTQLAAGYKHNVVPGEASASLDCRLLPDTDIDDLVARMRKQLARYGIQVSERARHRSPVSPRTPLYELIATGSQRAVPGCVVVPSLTTAMTDLRYFRARGAAGYGWVPLVLEPEDLASIHGHDERIEITGLERAVRAMSDVVLTAATE